MKSNERIERRRERREMYGRINVALSRLIRSLGVCRERGKEWRNKYSGFPDIPQPIHDEIMKIMNLDTNRKFYAAYDDLLNSLGEYQHIIDDTVREDLLEIANILDSVPDLVYQNLEDYIDEEKKQKISSLIDKTLKDMRLEK